MIRLPSRVRPGKFQFPVVTLVVIVVCLLVYLAQFLNTSKFKSVLKEFCVQEIKIHKNIFEGKSLAQKRATCRSVFKQIYLSDDKNLAFKAVLDNVKKPHRNPRIVRLVSLYLRKKYAEFAQKAPTHDLGMKLGFVAGSFDPIRMLTAVFTHGSWWHVLVNVFAFLVFASAAERLLGWRVFTLLFLFLVYSSHSLYSLLYLLGPSQVPEITIGLSGIVFAMMVFMALVLQRAKVQFVFWFIVPLAAMSLPIQLFVLFSVGMDLLHYALSGVQIRINFTVHWSGMIVGVLAAILIPLRVLRCNILRTVLSGLKGTYPIIKYKGSK